MNNLQLYGKPLPLLVDATLTIAECPCHGRYEQVDAFTYDGTPVRILWAGCEDGFSISIGSHPDNPDDLPPSQKYISAERIRQILKLHSLRN